MSIILKFFCVFLLAVGSVISAYGMNPFSDDTLRTRRVQGVQFADTQQELRAQFAANRRVSTFAGMSLSTDLAGGFLASVRGIGHYEAALRMNFRNTYFPIIELGIGTCDQTSDATQLHYTTHAPYGRIGLDYNLKKDKFSLNRVFIGFRYGFSRFNYDIAGANIVDEHWKTTIPFRYNSLSGNAHWAEMVFGLETSLWKFVHLGWSVRYCLRIAEHQAAPGRAWYVPGLGRNIGGSNFAGTFNLVFDLTHFRKTR